MVLCRPAAGRASNAPLRSIYEGCCFLVSLRKARERRVSAPRAAQPDAKCDTNARHGLALEHREQRLRALQDLEVGSLGFGNRLVVLAAAGHLARDGVVQVRQPLGQHRQVVLDLRAARRESVSAGSEAARSRCARLRACVWHAARGGRALRRGPRRSSCSLRASAPPAVRREAQAAPGAARRALRLRRCAACLGLLLVLLQDLAVDLLALVAQVLNACDPAGRARVSEAQKQQFRGGTRGGARAFRGHRARLSRGAQRMWRAGTRLRPGEGAGTRPGLRRLRCVPPRRVLLCTRPWRLGWRRRAAVGRRAAPAASGSPDAASRAAQPRRGQPGGPVQRQTVHRAEAPPPSGRAGCASARRAGSASVRRTFDQLVVVVLQLRPGHGCRHCARRGLTAALQAAVLGRRSRAAAEPLNAAGRDGLRAATPRGASPLAAPAVQWPRKDRRAPPDARSSYLAVVPAGLTCCRAWLAKKTRRCAACRCCAPPQDVARCAAAPSPPASPPARRRRQRRRYLRPRSARSSTVWTRRCRALATVAEAKPSPGAGPAA